MIVIERTVDLSKPISTETLRGNEFTGEIQAHTFKIHVTDNGTAVSLTGSVTGKMLLANGSGQMLGGSVEDGAAVVTLTQPCYQVPGRFHLAVYHTTGSGNDTHTTCIYSAVGSVVNATGSPEYAPGNVIPTPEQLAEMVDELEDAIAENTYPVSYEAQALTDAQKAQARTNIGAFDSAEYSPEYIYKLIMGDDSDWDYSSAATSKYKKAGMKITFGKTGSNGSTFCWVNLTGATHRTFTGSASGAKADIVANGNGDFVTLAYQLEREQATSAYNSYVALNACVIPSAITTSSGSNRIEIQAIFRRYNTETEEYEYSDLTALAITSGLTAGEIRMLGSANTIIASSSVYEKGAFETTLADYEEYAIYLMTRSQSNGGTVVLSPVIAREPLPIDANGIQVSGATPTITALPGGRYVCGTVTELTFTPSTSGICSVRFVAGSSMTLNLPNTVKMPDWWTSSSIIEGCTYEISVNDGQYGDVRSWASGAASSDPIANAVRYDITQSLTDTQKGTARTNIGAAAASDVSVMGTDVQALKTSTVREINRPMTFGRGTFNANTGETASSTTRARAYYFYVRYDAVIHCDPTAEYRVLWYEATTTTPYTYIGITPSNFTSEDTVVPKGSMIGVLARFKNDPSAEITTDQAKGFCNLIHLVYPLSEGGALKGMKLSFLGDSISAFEGYTSGYTAYYRPSLGYPHGVNSAEQMWWSVLCKATGMQLLVGNAESGSAITILTDEDHASKHPMSSDARTGALASNGVNPDIIIIAGGLNDYSYFQQASQEPGDWNGLTAPAEAISFTETYARMVKTLQTNYPKAFIVALSLYYTQRGTDNGWTRTRTSTGTGKTFSAVDYCNEIKKVAERMGIGYIDVYNMGVNESNFSQFVESGETTHYNRFGQAMVGRTIAHKLVPLVSGFLEGKAARSSQADIEEYPLT